MKYTGLGLGFDVTEVVMRAMGDDPYAAQKARIAEATREERFCLTLKDAEGDKRNALYRLKDNLEQIVADRTLSGAERRAAVFDLWEGCLDASDDLANAARATIAAFIRGPSPQDRERLHAGRTGHAQPPSQLQSPFDPYATAALSAAPTPARSSVRCRNSVPDSNRRPARALPGRSARSTGIWIRHALNCKRCSQEFPTRSRTLHAAARVHEQHRHPHPGAGQQNDDSRSP